MGRICDLNIFYRFIIVLVLRSVAGSCNSKRPVQKQNSAKNYMVLHHSAGRAAPNTGKDTNRFL